MNKNFVFPAIVLLLVILIISISKVNNLQRDITNEYIKVNQQEAIELINEGALLIDVRNKEEYAEGHIDGAINIPYMTLENEMSVSKDTKIIVYCLSGRRSELASKKLRDMGYKVYDFGAISDWK